MFEVTIHTRHGAWGAALAAAPVPATLSYRTQEFSYKDFAAGATESRDRGQSGARAF
jgi:hypothetical protein